jgi:predicted dehydrogenase
LSEIADGSWYDNPELCPVAPMFRIGIYLINDLIRLWGPVEEVQVMGARLCTGRPTPDTATAIIRFQNGALGGLFSSLCIDDREPCETHLILNYERGTIYRDIGPWDADKPLDDLSRLELACISPDGKNNYRSAEIKVALGGYQWEEFYKAVKGDQIAQPVDPEMIVTGLRVIQALKRADLSQKVERV